MSFMTFRNAYLAEAQTRLDAVDLAAADDNRLLVAGALYKMAGSVAQFDLLTVEAVSLLEQMDGPALDAWLADAANAAAFAQVCASSTAMAAVAASSTAMAAVIASSTAMAAVAASSTAMAAVIASSTAMAAVIASSTAMAAVAASSTAMAAVIASSTAMAAVIASSTAMAAVAASSTAMAAVIASSTAMAAVAANTAAWTAFVASTALTVATIPVMTGMYTPSGAATASTIDFSIHAAWKAMDGFPATFWLSAGAAPQWLQYEFAAPVCVHTLSFTGMSGYGYPTAFTVTFSDDGVTWSTASSGGATGIAAADFKVAAAGKHAYWRLEVSAGSTTSLAVAEFNLKGWF